MKFTRKYSYTLVTEDGKYSIVKNHLTNSYYIKSKGKKLIKGNSLLSFGKQKDAKAFIEKIYEEGIDDTFWWI